MCGICGMIDLAAPQTETRASYIKDANRAMHHRGPDEDGVYADDWGSIAMRRLSIIDLSGGTQPIYNEDASLVIVMNGEIYNYRELREHLLAKGHQFQTNSDTETLVHLYEEYGTEMPKYLKGMFAFSLIDKKQKRLFIGRDRFGEKPLFYYHDDKMFAFASELKSLLQHKKIPRKLNREALLYYLSISFVPDPMTLLQDIHSLPPGYCMTLDANGEMKSWAYFEPDYKIDDSLKTEQDVIAMLRPKLEQAVTRQKVSDVPLGAFLSGGIDSSTVVAMLQKNSTERIKTFTVKFEEATYDESHIAREVAEKLGTDHHEITIPNQNFTEDIFWTIIDHVGTPFPDSSAIPTYFISKEIRQHVKVALSGDGGDELFGGYPVFDWYRKVLSLQKIPSLLRKGAVGLLDLQANVPGLGGISKIRQARRAFSASTVTQEALGMALHYMFEPQEITKIVANGLASPQNLKNIQVDLPPEWKSWTPLRQIMYYRLRYNLPLDMLVKVDRMSMANSLEVRAPFLDPDLFEASAKIPDEFLRRDGKGKWIIRQMMANDLPDSVFNHPKSGFSIPLHKYQNEAFIKLAESFFNSNNPVVSLFDKTALQEILRNGLSNQADNARHSVYKSSHQLWTLMQLFGWAERFDVTV